MAVNGSEVTYKRALPITGAATESRSPEVGTAALVGGGPLCYTRSLMTQTGIQEKARFLALCTPSPNIYVETINMPDWD